MMRLVVGEAYGLSSPVKTYSPMFYIDVAASEGSKMKKANPTQEAAIFVVSGQVSIAVLNILSEFVL